jgi:hypothetical protein
MFFFVKYMVRRYHFPGEATIGAARTRFAPAACKQIPRSARDDSARRMTARGAERVVIVTWEVELGVRNLGGLDHERGDVQEEGAQVESDFSEGDGGEELREGLANVGSVFMSESGEVAVRAEEKRSASAACWRAYQWWAQREG